MRLFVLVMLLVFAGCSEKSMDSKENKFKAREAVTMALLNNETPDATSELLEDAKALIMRAQMGNYTLVDVDFMKNNDAIIVQTFESEIGDNGAPKIKGARIFAFARALSLNEDGSEWNWEADSLGKSMDDFEGILGDKNALIIFYDSGEDIFSPSGSAHTALLWANHLGYTNLVRLIGGAGALSN